MRTVVAAIEDAEAFATRLRTAADRLGVTLAATVTSLGDGAEWIWGLAEPVCPLADGVLAVYHAVEHIGDAVKAVWGDGTDATELHRKAGCQAALTGGKIGVERWLAGIIPANQRSNSAFPPASRASRPAVARAAAPSPSPHTAVIAAATCPQGVVDAQYARRLRQVLARQVPDPLGPAPQHRHRRGGRRPESVGLGPEPVPEPVRLLATRDRGPSRRTPAGRGRPNPSGRPGRPPPA